MKKSLIVLCTLLVTNAYSKTECISHRGNNIDHYENSISSIESALKMGAGVEFDVRHTLDKVSVILHDKKLKRTYEKLTQQCNLRKKISKQNYSQIADNCVQKDGLPIPKFEDFLKLISMYDQKVFIEFKDMPLENDIKLIKKNFPRRLNNVFIISFNKDYLNKVKYYISKYNLSKITILKLDVITKKNTVIFDGVDVRKIKKAKILKLKKKNQKISVWVKDSTKTIQKYIDLNVDFITTNNPRKCLRLLK